MLLRLCVIIQALLSNLKGRISLLLLALLSEVLLSHPTSQQETEQSLHTYSDYWDIGRNDWKEIKDSHLLKQGTKSEVNWQ